MIVKRTEARRIRATIVGLAATLPDKEASENAVLFPRMRYDGRLIAYQTRINWNGKLKQAAADLWDREENNPDNAPALWVDIAYYKGYRYIKVNASAAEAFKFGEYGWWQAELWESLMEGNPYTPETAPSVWRKVETA